MSLNILLCDDEKEIVELLALYLENEEYNIIKCFNGASAVKAVEAGDIDLAVLDVMLPDIDGFSICKKIREKHTFPIIMLTAKGDDQDRIHGLTIGADDYISKPFNPLEAVARIKAQLRRYKNYNETVPGNVFEIRGLSIDKESHECILNGEQIALTPIEFDILWTLCDNAGKVVSAEELFETVWGEQYLDANNTVMVHIRRLREKLHEEPRNPKYIKTVWGVGYKVEK